VKYWTRIRRHFLFSTVAGIYVVFINVIAYVQTLPNFGCIDGCQSLSRSRILNFEKHFGPGSGPRLKNFEVGAELEPKNVTPATSESWLHPFQVAHLSHFFLAAHDC